MQRQHPMRHCSTLGKASMIVSFQAKQNNKQKSPFNISDNLNIKCDTEDLFFNCPRDWWMIWKKIYTRLRLSAAPKVVISFYRPSPHLKEEVAV